jgi:flavin reductase (DIM6/NTAB) family NADH-FMN oxidoreductase RutF
MMRVILNVGGSCRQSGTLRAVWFSNPVSGYAQPRGRSRREEFVLERGQLRAAFARMATNVAVVTVADDEGSHGCTANAWGESLDPPLLLMTLRSTSSTRERIVDCGRVGINLLANTQLRLAKQFARPGPRFEGVNYRLGTLGQPLLDGCLASFGCSLAAVHPFGSYEILIGSVQEALCDQKVEPLLFFNGHFCETSAMTVMAPPA